MSKPSIHDQKLADEKVRNAVIFLREICRKGYREEANLRRYLTSSRGLTAVQADEAFKIHSINVKAKDAEKKSKSDTAHQFPDTYRRVNDRKSLKSTGERPERFTEYIPKNVQISRGILAALIPSQRKAGQKLLKNFLTAEKGYCKTLQCLKYYYTELGLGVVNRKFSMTQKEVDGIFHHIPELLESHTNFCRDLTVSGKIGRVKFIYKYIEYMKDCIYMIATMRDHIFDLKLRVFLDKTKNNSALKTHYLVDLLLVPLERVVEYKQMFEKLLEFTDCKQKMTYDFIKKSLRRIKRVTRHVEKYKWGIVNKSEMNKIQLFLGKQCKIFRPGRSIVRRGNMICRNKGWVSRKMNCVVFLFTDILVWATCKGDLQNAVYLIKCHVLPSNEKSNTQRRFKVEFTEQHRKTLLLECKSERQRDEWYSTIEETIKRVNKASVQKKDERFKDEAWMKAEGRTREQLKRDSKGKTSLIEYKSGMNCSGEQKAEANYLGEGSKDTKAVSVSSEPSKSWGFYEESRNFADQDLEDFENFECTVSDVSDTDYQSTILGGKPADLSPFSSTFLDDNKRDKNDKVSQIESKEHAGTKAFQSEQIRKKIVFVKSREGKNINTVRRQSRIIHRHAQNTMEIPSPTHTKKPPVTVLVDKNFIRDSKFSQSNFVRNEVDIPSIHKHVNKQRQLEQPKSPSSCYTISLDVLTDK